MFDPNYYTVKEFHLNFRALTKLKKQWSEDYIRRCCRGDIDPRTGKKYRLPEGWEAFKLAGKQWSIRKKKNITLPTETQQNNIEEAPTMDDEIRRMLKSIRQARETASIPALLIRTLVTCRGGAIREKRRHILTLVFETDGVIKVELRQPSGELLFNYHAAPFYSAWLDKVLESNLHLTEAASNTVEGLKRIAASPAHKELFADFRKRCFYCTKYRKPDSKSMYCKNNNNCKKNLSRFIRSLSGKSWPFVDKKITARLAKLFRSSRTLRIEPSK